MKHVKQEEITVKNDIGTELVVRVSQDECEGDEDYLDIEVIINPDFGYVFYFNTEEEFRDWILNLQKTFL